MVKPKPGTHRDTRCRTSSENSRNQFLFYKHIFLLEVILSEKDGILILSASNKFDNGCSYEKCVLLEFVPRLETSI